MDLPQHPFGAEITLPDIDTLMASAQGWEDRYRNVIQLGKKLPILSNEYQQENVKIHGCESQVWLIHQQDNERWLFAADSDARIVRGLIALILVLYNEKTTEQIQAVNVKAEFEKWGLLSHLSPSRSNGLFAIVEAIKNISQNS